MKLTLMFLAASLIVEGAMVTMAIPQAIAQEPALTAGTPAAQLSHTKSIQPSVTKPVYVIMNSNDYINGGITHSTSRNAADVIVNKEGSYLIVASGQVGKTSGNTTCNVNLWLKQNGQDVANSNTRYAVNTKNDTVVLVSQAIMPLKMNDTISPIMSVSQTNQGCGLINTLPPGEPDIPAIIFSIVRIGS